MAYATPIPPVAANPIGSLDELAAAFALHPVAEAEELIESFCAEAVRQWRLHDATFWQRVKFRARLLRAMQAPHDDNHLQGRQ